MSKQKSFQIAELNFVTHPHSASGYVDLFQSMFSLMQPISMRGTQHLMIGELRAINENLPMEGAFGRLYRFDQIDPKAPWFNVANHAAASKEEISQIKIPDELKPNLIMFNFVFYPKKHRMYFETLADRNSLGPQSALRFFERLVSHPNISKKFPIVDITIVPDSNQVGKVLSVPGMRKLVIDIKRPNPDGGSHSSSLEMERRLKSIGAKRFTQEFTASGHEHLKPDENMRETAEIASVNGSVYSVGRSADGRKIEESTAKKPHFETIRYDSSVETREDALIAKTS